MPKVLLKKEYIVPKTGSRYPRGVYDTAALPYIIRTDKEWTSPIEEVQTEAEKQDERYLNLAAPPVKTLNKVSYKEKPKLNINSATVAELMQMPGISTKRAKAIIANRPYADMADFKRRANLTAFNVDELDWEVATARPHTEVSGMTRTEEKIPEARPTKQLRPDERISKKKKLVQQFVKEEL